MTTTEKTLANYQNLSLEERQHEFSHCTEKLKAAIILQDEEQERHYSELVVYLYLFVQVDEVLDLPKRVSINLFSID